MTRSLAAQLTATLAPVHLNRLQQLAGLAAAHDQALYVVGGFVRDLLLGRTNLDFDLVIEADALIFAEQVQQELGGSLVTHTRFHTATWTPPDAPVVEIDLVSARREIYTQPAALPTVTLSTLADDISRRDFTINTLAIRLDGDHFGELIDLLNGEGDLQAGLVDVLHPNSFIDDPTRLFRAVRYEQRYGFRLTPDTLALIPSALPGIDLLSGDRLRHELELILNEKESNRCAHRLAQLGLLQKVHPALTPPADDAPLTTFAELTAGLSAEEVVATVERLNLSRADVTLIEQVREARSFLRNNLTLSMPLSTLHTQAKALPDLALMLALKLDLSPAPIVELINTYLTRRHNLHLHTNGQTIAALGLAPGPKYKDILFRLECAYLDQAITEATQEQTLLEKLVAEVR